MISRLVLFNSNLANRCLVISYNNQINRYSAHTTLRTRPPGRIRRFFRWFGWGAEPIVSTVPPITNVQQVKRFFLISPSIERFFLRSRIIEDEDLARLISKTAAITIYALLGVTTLGTLGVDTKPLLAGIGVTGFTIGFALKEVATNFISGIFLVINKPFVRGCRIKIHGSGGGIEGKIYIFLFLKSFSQIR
jgi:small-conductance mechanosensitive channel